MKKTFIGISALILSSVLFAQQQQSVTTLQEEILNLAKQRHELLGKNIELRTRMLAVQKEIRSAQADDARDRMAPLWADLRQNQQQIRSLSKSIHEKRRILANLIRTKKMHGKDKKSTAVEDISNID